MMAGITLLTRFMLEFGFPWLALVKGTQSNNAEIMDFMWAFALPWFRATDKTNYGPMCVHVNLIDELMSDEVKSVWRANRTISLRGHRGRNVAWDYGNERQNCEFKGGLRGFITRERLEEFPVLMNGYKHVAAQMAAAWFVDENGADVCDQYSHILPEDNAALVSALEALLGSNAPEVHEKASATNPFGSSSGRFPWEEVSAAKTGLEAFVRTHCDGLRTGEIDKEE